MTLPRTLVRFALLVYVWIGVAMSVAADQSAAELPSLFAELAEAPNAAAAQDIEQRIWRLWFDAPNAPAAELFQRGRDTAQRGDLAGARALFDELIESSPRYAEAWNQRAIVHFLMNDLDGALADVAQTLELEPRHFGALSGRAQCYLRRQRPREALAAFEAALDINPWMDLVRRQAEALRTMLAPAQTTI
jgi:tetratricopeptide (TPR) repeat protein